ncbi:hypothetical protein LW135_05485 [Helicobacter sp. faydin-H20]|uniref:hypothetical protein n=1 Tax=Helicobacter anatolicus TaxID=2905874 RepID=UPI001E3A3A65|nr:hypothetical protein [Helicobacter anatolicus]MCE3037282.1 hypothetical protein [Helicobacter anatolicus]
MDSILYFYRDPLFDIIILFSIIATIALLDYSRNKYRTHKKQQSLQALAQSYEHTTLNEDMSHFITLYPKATPFLINLAQTYAQSGDNEMAIKIFLSLLESNKNTKTKIVILESLGKTYLNAGFMQKSKDIFTQILKTYPRNATAMKLLIKSYENMGEYQKALEALECLDEIDSQTQDFYTNNQQYFYLLILLNAHNIPLYKKIQNATIIGKNNPLFDKIILRYLKNYDLKAFWNYVFCLDSVTNIIDILWEISQENLHDEIINYPQIFEIFVAKGYFESKKECSIFELEILRTMHTYSTKKIHLAFEYRCHHCKAIFPFDSPRCPQCEELTQLDLILKPLQKIEL